jgi:hypothetical protein
MSKFLSILFSSVHDVNILSDDILENTTEYAALTEELSRLEEELNALLVEIDQGQDVYAIVDGIRDAVATEGYTTGMAKICTALGISDMLQSHYSIRGIGTASLHPTGQNNEVADLVVHGCESMLQGWWEKLEAFFRAFLKHLAKFFEKIKERIPKMRKYVDAAFTRYQKTDAEKRKNLTLPVKDTGGLSYQEFRQKLDEIRHIQPLQAHFENVDLHRISELRSILKASEDMEASFQNCKKNMPPRMSGNRNISDPPMTFFDKVFRTCVYFMTWNGISRA